MRTPHKQHAHRGVGDAPAESVLPAGAAFNRIRPWLPLAFIALYTTGLGVFALLFHRIGRFGVETDFYAELVPPAKQLLAGAFSPRNYGAKGPVYSLVLAGVFTLVRDWFRAGLVINFAACLVFLAALHSLVRRMFNPLTAALSVLAIAGSLVFESHLFKPCSDIVFMAFCTLSMMFLFQGTGRRSIVLSAFFALLGFLTRYNGAFLVVGSVMVIALSDGSVAERMKRLGLWIAVFVVVGLPWFVPTWHEFGNPVYNENYRNIALEFYGMDDNAASSDGWTDRLPRDFTGVGDIIMHDPAYFAVKYTKNIGNHFVQDMRQLVGLHLALFLVPGFLLFFFAGVERWRVLFLMFGASYFLILALTFYNPRFSLFLEAIYIPAGLWPFTVPWSRIWVRRVARAVVWAFIGVAVTGGFVATRTVAADILNPPAFLLELHDLGTRLKGMEADPAKRVMARFPHVAFFAGLTPVMFPDDAATEEDLAAYCRDNHIDYVVYSGIEAQMRPNLRSLMMLDDPHPAFDLLFYNRFGVVYRVRAGGGG